MTVLTDEIVEKAARGIVNCVDLTCHCWRHHFDDARAALEAVLPDVVESAAKAAEGRDPNALVYRWVLARDIRSLLNKEDK